MSIQETKPPYLLCIKDMVPLCPFVSTGHALKYGSNSVARGTVMKERHCKRAWRASQESAPVWIDTMWPSPCREMRLILIPSCHADCYYSVYRKYKLRSLISPTYLTLV